MSNIQKTQTEIADIIYDIAVFNQTIFVARQTGLYHSLDGGVNWINTYHPSLPESNIPTLTVELSPNYENDKTIVAGINGGICLSTDSGETWLVHQFRKPIPMVTSIAVSPNFATDKVILAGTYEDGMFRSDNAGETWQAFNYGLFDHNILCVAISPFYEDDQTVYAGTSSGIYKSINGGKLWHDLTLPNDYDAVLSLVLSPDGELYVGTETNGMLKSLDNGATWTTIFDTDSAINSILIGANNRLIAQLNDAVMISDDGTTWTSLISSDVNIVILSEDQQFIIAGLTDTTIQQINLFDL